MKKKKLHAMIVAANAEIAELQQYLQAAVETMIKQHKKQSTAVTGIEADIAELDKRITSTIGPINKHTEQIGNIAKHMNEPRSVFRRDLAAQVGGALVNAINDVLAVRDGEETAVAIPEGGESNG